MFRATFSIFLDWGRLAVLFLWLLISMSLRFEQLFQHLFLCRLNLICPFFKRVQTWNDGALPQATFLFHLLLFVDFFVFKCILLFRIINYWAACGNSFFFTLTWLNFSKWLYWTRLWSSLLKIWVNIRVVNTSWTVLNDVSFWLNLPPKSGF